MASRFEPANPSEFDTSTIQTIEQFKTLTERQKEKVLFSLKRNPSLRLTDLLHEYALASILLESTPRDTKELDLLEFVEGKINVARGYWNAILMQNPGDHIDLDGIARQVELGRGWSYVKDQVIQESTSPRRDASE